MFRVPVRGSQNGIAHGQSLKAATPVPITVVFGETSPESDRLPVVLPALDDVRSKPVLYRHLEGSAWQRVPGQRFDGKQLVCTLMNVGDFQIFFPTDESPSSAPSMDISVTAYIYPSPVHNRQAATVHVEGSVLTKAQLHLYDVSGNLVLSKDMDTTSPQGSGSGGGTVYEQSIDLGPFTSGMYPGQVNVVLPNGDSQTLAVSVAIVK